MTSIALSQHAIIGPMMALVGSQSPLVCTFSRHQADEFCRSLPSSGRHLADVNMLAGPSLFPFFVLTLFEISGSHVAVVVVIVYLVLLRIDVHFLFASPVCLICFICWPSMCMLHGLNKCCLLRPTDYHCFVLHSLLDRKTIVNFSEHHTLRW